MRQRCSDARHRCLENGVGGPGGCGWGCRYGCTERELDCPVVPAALQVVCNPREQLRHSGRGFGLVFCWLYLQVLLSVPASGLYHLTAPRAHVDTGDYACGQAAGEMISIAVWVGWY